VEKPQAEKYFELDLFLHKTRQHQVLDLFIELTLDIFHEDKISEDFFLLENRSFFSSYSRVFIHVWSCQDHGYEDDDHDNDSDECQFSRRIERKPLELIDET